MTPQEEISNMFNDLSLKAVEMAKSQGVDLNYSNESIEKLESLLNTMHEQIARETPVEEQFVRMANIFGAYLGNTLIKNLERGIWELEPTHNAWGVKIEGKYMFFPSKVYRRLKNGFADNVVQMYVREYNQFSSKPITLKIF